MKFRYMLLFFLMLLPSFFIIQAEQKVHASVLTGSIDTTGSITGLSGATYYNTASWQDMVDTYKGVTPTASSNGTVFFNVTGNIPGNAVLNTGNVVISGKSLSINGNNFTLYLDNDTTYTNAQSIGGSDGTARAFGSNGTISSSTTLTLKNAQIINNITSGIFR